MHYQFSLQVSNTQGVTVAQAVAAAVRKAVAGVAGASVSDAIVTAYTGDTSECYLAYGNVLTGSPADPLDFGGALAAAKASRTVSRPGMNGSVALHTPQPTEFLTAPFLIIVAAGAITQYEPTQADLLAEDWTVVG